MIEDKKIGLKVAENPLEKLWILEKEKAEARMKSFEEALVIDRVFLKMCEEQAKKAIGK